MIARAVVKGPRGKGLLIVDAGDPERTAAEVGAAPPGPRVPAWMLPHVPYAARLKMRPDILLVTGLPDMRLSQPLALADYTPTGEESVFLLEVGYCNDTRAAAKMREKLQQHAGLIAALREAGWKNVRCIPIVLGVAGSVYSWMAEDTANPPGSMVCDDLLRGPQILKLSAKLNDHAVTSLHHIVCTRRSLEKSPAAQTRP